MRGKGRERTLTVRGLTGNIGKWVRVDWEE